MCKNPNTISIVEIERKILMELGITRNGSTIENPDLVFLYAANSIEDVWSTAAKVLEEENLIEGIYVNSGLRQGEFEYLVLSASEDDDGVARAMFLDTGSPMLKTTYLENKVKLTTLISTLVELASILNQPKKN